MRNRSLKILLPGLLVLPSLPLFARGNGITSSGQLWSYLLLVLVFVVLTVAFMIRKKNQKSFHRLKKLQEEAKTTQQELDLLKKNREEIIQQRVKSLHDMLENRKQNIKSMESTLAASEQAARRNSFLLTKISHTLRTNLNDILGFSLLMGNEFALGEEEELFEFNENIRKSGESLMHLLNNIIDISKIESKNFQINEEECHLADISQEIIKQYEPTASQKEIKIVFQDDKIPPFAGDKEAIKHILSNLLDNAIRYTEKGFVKIAQKLDNKTIIWSVKDTGTGIDKAYLPDIFEPFRQQSLGYSKTSYQGAGLGLPLIKNMLDLIGGSVTISSEIARGTTVTVSLPFKTFTKKDTKPVEKATSQKSEKSASKTVRLKKQNARILIMDEDRLGNMLIKKIIPKAIIDTCDTGMDPYKWMEQQLKSKVSPDVLLIELDFSGKKKGQVVLQKMKEHFPVLEQIPTIALSAYPDPNGSEKAIKQGFSAYLQKPFHKIDLISLLNRIIPS